MSWPHFFFNLPLAMFQPPLISSFVMVMNGLGLMLVSRGRPRDGTNRSRFQPGYQAKPLGTSQPWGLTLLRSRGVCPHPARPGCFRPAIRRHLRLAIGGPHRVGSLVQAQRLLREQGPQDAANKPLAQPGPMFGKSFYWLFGSIAASRGSSDTVAKLVAESLIA